MSKLFYHLLLLSLNLQRGQVFVLLVPGLWLLLLSSMLTWRWWSRHIRQKLWPHGIRIGHLDTSRQIGHWTPRFRLDKALTAEVTLSEGCWRLILALVKVIFDFSFTFSVIVRIDSYLFLQNKTRKMRFRGRCFVRAALPNFNFIFSFIQIV